MDSRQETAKNFKEYVKWNHELVHYTQKMEYFIIQDIKNNNENLSNYQDYDDFMGYFEDVILESFSRSPMEQTDLESGIDYFNNSNINEHTDNYLETRNTEDFITAVIKNVGNHNFVLLIDSFYKAGSSWKNTILDFFNIFVNRLINQKFIVSAVFFTIDSTDGISFMFEKISKINNRKRDLFLKNLNKTHQKKVDDIIIM